MKKIIFWAALSAAAVSGLVSCGKEQGSKPEAQTHTVSIQASNPEVGGGLKTGISLKMVPNWKNTDLASIHVFENDVEGTTTALDIEQGKPENGTITAEFPAGGEAPFTYNAVVASSSEEGRFIVPAVQTPSSESLIDPNADFIVGQKVSESDNLTKLAIAFKRPIAVSRACFANFDEMEEGEKLLKVVITSNDNSFTGSAAYTDIDFEQGTVAFTPDAAGKVLTISYGTGITLSSSFNYVYFTCLPGTYNVGSMTVYTETTDGKCYKYEKTSNKEMTFSNEEFKNINVNMNGIEKQRILKPGAAYYELETAAASELSTDGTPYIIVYNSSSNYYAFKPILDGDKYKANADNRITVDAIDGKIESNETVDACQITFASGSNGKYKITVVSTDTPLYLSSSGLKNSSEEVTIKKSSDGKYTIQGSSYYLNYSSSGYFQSKSSSTNLQLYKLTDSRQVQTPAFSKDADSFELTSGETYVAPKLTGVLSKGTVTYSSSNEDVATVDQSGKVDPLKKGTAIITADVAGDDAYKPATASYTLTVTDASIQAEYYTKVTSIDELPERPATFVGTEAYGNYLFVYEDGKNAYVLNAKCEKAPTGTGTTTSGHEPLISPNFITVSLTENGIEATDEVKACKLQLQRHKDSGTDSSKKNCWNVYGVECQKGGTYWLGFVDKNGIEAMTTTGYSATYTIENTIGNNVTILRGTSYYFGYSTDNGFVSDNKDSKRKVSIYKLSE